MRNICIAYRFASGELERVQCMAICSLDSARRDTELRGNLDAGVSSNATHDEREPAKDIKATAHVFGFFDQKSKVPS